MGLSEIVNVVISLQTGGVSRAGFGTLLVLDPNLRTTNRSDTYATATAMGLVFESTDPAYVAASTFFAQDPRPTQIKIGRRKVDAALVQVRTVADSTNYVVTINGTAFTYASGVGATRSAIVTGLAALINAGAEPVTATAQTDVLLLVLDSGTGWTLSVSTTYLDYTVHYKVLQIDTVGAGTYTVTITCGCNVATPFSFVATGYHTKSNVADGIVAAINAGSLPITAQKSLTDDVIVWADIADPTATTPLYAQTAFGMALTSQMSLKSQSITEAISDAIDAIVVEDNDWYHFAMTSRLQAEQLAAAAKIETLYKVYGTASCEAAIADTTVAADTTSLAALFQSLNRYRSWVLYHPDANGDNSEVWPEIAWIGDQITIDLDVKTSTWALKEINGVASYNLTDTQKINIYGTILTNTGGKNCNALVSFNGTDYHTIPGKVGAGEWIDVIIGRDWLQFRMQEDIFYDLTHNDKIAYTDAGIAMIVKAVKGRLSKGIDTQFLRFDNTLNKSEGYSVTWPVVDDILPADRADRVLNNVKFVATVAGAIHAVQITGEIAA